MKKYISYLLRSGLAVLALVLLQLGANPFAQAQQTGADFDHSATGFVLNAQHQNVRCETCHIRGVFKGTPKTCEACHGWTNPIATTVMPIKHIPTGNAPCESCHQANMSQFNDALRAFSHVSVPSQSCMACHDSRNPRPGVTVNPSDATHAKVQANNTPCGVCHTTIQFEGPKPPPNHIPFAAVACANCHVGTDYSVMPTIAAIHANAPSSSNNCAQCHSATAAATYALPTMVPPLVGPPANHIGMSNQSCEVCHVGAGSSLQLPVVDGAKFSNSKFSHQGISTGCAACHGPNVSASSFIGMRNIIVMPDSSSPGPMAHIPSSTTCETCHASSMPAGQINAAATATVPGTGFQLPKPSKEAVHLGVTSNCSSCHEAGMLWVGMQLYPLAGYTGFQTRPQLAAGTFNVANAFHPSIGDCSQCHVGISFDPANTKKPANHIPTIATCGSCHKDRNGDYAVMPALSDIHANSQPGMTCVQCHSTSNAAKYPMTPALMSPPGNHIPMGAAGCETCHVGPGSSMASTVVQDGDKFSGSLFSHSGISGGCDTCHGASVNASTFYGVVPVALSGLVPSHMPTSAACETCHVNKIPTVLTPAGGVNFSGAKFSHAGISSGCDACHGPNIVPASFAGSPNIVVMPPNTAPGATSHIPSSTACESCHLLSTPTGLVDGSAASTTVPGSKFMLPAPSTSQIHTYSDVSSCNLCHEAGRTFMGMGQYQPTPGPYVAGNIYRGFQTRPNGTGGGNSIQDSSHPAGTGECSNCHNGYNGFGGLALPATHMPVLNGAACSSCHADTGAFVMPVSIGTLHQFIQSTSTNCAQCHSEANSARFPLKHPVRAIKAPPTDHIPMGTAGCESCHMGSATTSIPGQITDSSVFSGSKFNHAGTNVACSTCHGVNVTSTTYAGLPNIKVIDYAAGSDSHMPVSSQLSCDTCHTSGAPTGYMPDNVKTFAGAQFNHIGITTDCANCHGPTISSASFRGGDKIVVMPSTTSGPTGHIPSGNTCENCHLLAKPAGLISAVATRTVPGTGFQNSYPNSATIHGNVTVGTCDNCHGSGKEWAGMSLYPSNPLRSATRVAGTIYTGFQTRPGGTGPYAVPDSGHTTIETCSNCHTNFTGFGPPTMPGNHIPVLATASCANCHTNVDYSVMPAKSAIHKYAPSFTSNCAQCHAAGSETKYPMTPPLKVADSTHMPLGGQACETCHVDSVTNLSTNDTPTFSGSKFSHAGASTGCAACHVAGVGPFQGIAVTSQGSGPIVAINVPGGGATASATVHMPYTTSCETCHSNSTPSTLLAVTASTGNAAVGSSGFSSPKAPVASIHIGATTCNSCHETGVSGSIGWMGLTAAANRATTTAPYKGFQTRPDSAPTTTFRVQDAIHPTGGDCSSCHTGFTDFSSIALPQYHIPTAAVQCIACHTANNYSASSPPTLTAIHANAQSTTGNCAQCHSKANADYYNQLVGIGKPIVAPHSTHVDMGKLGCESCHVTSTVVSSLSLPVTTGADFRNSAYSHSGVSTGCASCHFDLTVVASAKTFAGGPSGQVLTVKAAPVNHVTNSGSTGCETCHVTVPAALIGFNGVPTPSTANSFGADKMYSHKGITTGCSTCHAGSPAFIGIANMVVLPPTTPGNHIPTSSAINANTCEACHAKSTPSALVSVAPGTPKAVGTTGFLSPLPLGTDIHKGVTTGCNTCHDNTLTWLGVGLYPRTANTNPKKAGASYVGFQTRPMAAPGIYGQTDISHPTGGDCSACHGSTTSFTVSAMPANHIPIAGNATCDACHSNISIVNGLADFSQKPSLANIHKWAPSQTVNCALCHSETNAAKYTNLTSTPSATIPFSPLSVPSGIHVPYGTTACETCHIVSGPIGAGASFANAKYSHTGVTTNCADCHAAGKAFYGIANLVTIDTSPTSAGATKHIPSGATKCEVCHAGSTPSTLSNVSPSGSPLASPSTGFRLPVPTGVMIHNGVTNSCNKCHDTGYQWIGVELYPINPNVVTAGASYKGFQTRPISGGSPLYGINDATHPTTGDCSQCHVGTTAFTALAKPAGHMPVAAGTCSTCHSTPTTDYSVIGLGTKPGNLPALHTGIKTGMVTYTAATIGTKTCVTCHVVGTGGVSGTAPFTGCANSTNCSSPPAQNFYQPTLKDSAGAHVPIGTLDCNGCHAVVTPSFLLTNMMKNQTMHDNAKLGGVLCKDCHENGMSWNGVTGLKVRIPNKHTTAARKAPNNCDNSGCHANSTVSNGFRMLAQPIMREALVSPDMERVRPNMLPGGAITRGSLGNTYDHKGVQSGQCKTCHDGKAASGMPARHLMVTTSCDTCHRPTSWTPAQFSHSGVTPNTCMACHNGMSASSKPPGHFMTARSCDSCHKTVGWKPVLYQHMSPQYHPTPDALNCTSCHITNGEIIPRQMRGLTRTKPIPVGP